MAPSSQAMSISDTGTQSTSWMRIAAICLGTLAVASCLHACGRIGFDSQSLEDEQLCAVGPQGNLRSIGSEGQVFSGVVTIAAGEKVLRAMAFPNVDVGDRVVVEPGQAEQEVFHVVCRLSATKLVVAPAALLAHKGSATIGRAYTDPATWEIDRQGDLIAEKRLEVGVLYSGSLDEPIVINGSNTNAEYYMHLRVADSTRHQGLAGTGLVLRPTVSANAVEVFDDYFRLEGLEITQWASGGDARAAAVAVAANNVRLSKLVIHDDERASGDGDTHIATGIRLGSPGATLFITNSMLYNIIGPSILIARVAVGSTIEVSNSTIFACGVDFVEDIESGCIQATSNNAVIARNVIAVAKSLLPAFAVGPDYSGSSNNLSDDQTAPGASPQSGDDTVFVSTQAGAVDLHLHADTAASGQGIVVEGIADDIDGEPRAVPWDIGADDQ